MQRRGSWKPPARTTAPLAGRRVLADPVMLPELPDLAELPDLPEPFDGLDLFDDEFDTDAEVDAAFRTQRRVALGYFSVFIAVTLAVPTLTLVLGWWSDGRIVGMSPNFLMAAGGLYLVFFVVALAAASLADAVEDRMLGGGDEHLAALPDADGLDEGQVAQQADRGV